MGAVEEIGDIAEALKRAEEYGLLPEVVWSAMSYLKETPAATISEAIEYGVSEWVK